MDTCIGMRSGKAKTSWSAYHSGPNRHFRAQRMHFAFVENTPALTVGRVPAAVAEHANASTYDAELQRLLLAGPPANFDFRAEATAGSQQWVDEHAPQLRDLVHDGTLVAIPRRPDYRERRTDGYCEPAVVLLVGTAHVSRRSQRDVDRVIRAVHPDCVVVELCKGRSAALLATGEGPPHGASSPSSGTDPRVTDWAESASKTWIRSGSSYHSGADSDSDSELGSNDARLRGKDGDGSVTASSSGSSRSRPGTAEFINPMNLAGGVGGEGGVGGPPGAGFLAALSRSVALGGQDALLLRVLLAGLARRTAGSLGVAGGGEFAAARAAAEEVGAQVVLGDRPVEITLSRAWAALSLPRRLKLCGELLRGALGTPRQALNEEVVERLKSDDAVSAFFNQLSSSYPELVGPLVTERDLYLTWSLKRSKAVNGAGTVVGVVGRGHLRGVVYTLLRDQGGAGLRFSELVEGRNSRRRRREQAAQGLQRLVIEVALGAAAYFVWLAFNQGL